MNTGAEIGRIGGTPVIIDASFILLVALWGYPYFTSADLTSILMGLWIVAGVAGSILVHELSHALAARWYGVGTSHVELNGLGGLCYYTAHAPSRQARVFMALAGPASNLALWGLFTAVATAIGMLPPTIAGLEGHDRFIHVANMLASTNFILFWFNLLPSHPLDGGTALANVLGGTLGYDRAMRLVAWTGMAVVAWLALMSVGVGMFAALVAAYLFMSNQRVLEVHRGPRWTRRG
jgi:Zn-dependent protease